MEWRGDRHMTEDFMIEQPPQLSRIVGRFGCSSLEVHERHVRDNPNFFTAHQEATQRSST
jgi:hypothetical protein